MKYLLAPLPVVFSASIAAAHDSAHRHHHFTDPNWLPLLGGLLVIRAAALLAWVSK